MTEKRPTIWIVPPFIGAIEKTNGSKQEHILIWAHGVNPTIIPADLEATTEPSNQTTSRVEWYIKNIYVLLNYLEKIPHGCLAFLSQAHSYADLNLTIIPPKVGTQARDIFDELYENLFKDKPNVHLTDTENFPLDELPETLQAYANHILHGKNPFNPTDD